MSSGIDKHNTKSDSEKMKPAKGEKKKEKSKKKSKKSRKKLFLVAGEQQQHG